MTKNKYVTCVLVESIVQADLAIVVSFFYVNLFTKDKNLVCNFNNIYKRLPNNDQKE